MTTLTGELSVRHHLAKLVGVSRGQSGLQHVWNIVVTLLLL